jgi:hypothetical protein
MYAPGSGLHQPAFAVAEALDEGHQQGGTPGSGAKDKQ